MLPGGVVLSRTGAAVAADFANATGAPIVGDTATGNLYWFSNGQLFRVASYGVNVMGKGATGDGVTDDTTAIENALTAGAGNAIYFPAGNYLYSRALTIPGNTKLFGDGRFVSTLVKGFNGSAITLQDGGEIADLAFTPNGFTGKCFTVTGSNQILSYTRMNAWPAYCVEFVAAGSGSNFKMIGGEATRASASDPSFGFPVTDTAGTPRYFKGVSTGGGVFCDINNATDTFIENCFQRDLNWNDNSNIVVLSNNRLAALAGDMHIKGGGHVITGNSIAATNIYLDAGTNGIYLRGNGGYSNVIDNSGMTLNSYEYPRKTYTPVWDQSSGVQPVLNDGTITGNTCRDGQICTFNIFLTMGPSTTFGNAGAGYRFSLPHQVYSQGRHSGTCFITDASTSITTTYAVTLNAGLSTAQISNMAGGAVRDGSPIAWANGDTINIFGTYLCD